MKRKKAIFLLVLALAAAALIGTGLFRVLRIYRHYRADMLTYESRHMNSIASSGARGLGWMLDDYTTQVGQLAERRNILRAEEEYLSSGDREVMRQVMTRPDLLRPYMRCFAAVFDERGALLAASDNAFPAEDESDVLLGDKLILRTDGQGDYWFVFSAVSSAGFQYELAVPVQAMFSYIGEATPVGRNGYLFLMDRGGQFVSYTGSGGNDTCSTEELLARFPAIGSNALEQVARREQMRPEEYMVFRYPWPGSTTHGGDESLVVTAPVTQSGGTLLLGTLISFREFDSFLSDMMQEITWVILMEMGGALILFLLGAWILVMNRRNSLELAAVRERADLMEEINRQQQSLAHTERLQQLGVMTSGIVHEFNNLLTPIMGQSLLLLEQLADQEDSPQFEQALDIYEASENARDILRRMSGMGKRDVDMSFRTLEVAELLHKTMNLSDMARDPHITRELVLPKEPLYLSCNEQLLTQALLNLCINACQAMEDAGTLTVEAMEEERSGRRYATIRVSDTGPGISEDKIGSIYDPFFTTKGEHGTGLGLAICQKIIETHKGTIQAANRESGGAVFTVRIPAVLPAAPEEL